MRYIHDGELRDKTTDVPPVFVFDEANTHGTGRTDTALRTAAALGPQLTKLRKTETTPLVIGHGEDRWRWTDE
ncbi:hypothetical protein SAMN04487967_1705 [Natronorubrum sediminis]|uniref:Uncharacterized protein n=1 Tax=Natronorubrum sediminis TaxID=640943 RepID=A0A1H6FXB1_9EURY|nr:hypothetical protein [Natronorubrum sediminis]SEH14653.1 hypothetical protein SAMN04487967_1705 [Natronorubrum sediminis]